MSWTYEQRTGQLRRDGVLLWTGYSGHGEGKNNPEKQAAIGVGPLPCGRWKICGPPYDTTKHGPYVLRLEPEPGTELFGRAGFLMHGDSGSHPGEASEGCIIMPREIRKNVWESGDHELEVISGIQP